LREAQNWDMRHMTRMTSTIFLSFRFRKLWIPPLEHF